MRSSASGRGRRKSRYAEARREIGLRVVPAAEGQGAADVQVLDVDVHRTVAVVHVRRLVRIPELVEAVVALAVAQFERYRVTAALVQVAAHRRVLVLEAATHAIAPVQTHLEGQVAPRPAGGGGQQEGGGGKDRAIHGGVRLSHMAGLRCHCEQESFALRSSDFAPERQGLAVPDRRCGPRFAGLLRRRTAARDAAGSRTVAAARAFGRRRAGRTALPRRIAFRIRPACLPDLPPARVRARRAACGHRLDRRAGMDVPGIRNSPSIRYASFTPPFGYDAEGAAFGGLFRDGRAASLIEQAKLPVHRRARDGECRARGRDRAPARIAECRALSGRLRRGRARRSGRRLQSPRRRHRAVRGGESRIPPFRQQVRRVPCGQGRARAAGARGLELFEDAKKGNCAACHPSRRGEDGSPPLFTDFTL